MKAVRVLIQQQKGNVKPENDEVIDLVGPSNDMQFNLMKREPMHYWIQNHK